MNVPARCFSLVSCAAIVVSLVAWAEPQRRGAVVAGSVTLPTNGGNQGHELSRVVVYLDNNVALSSDVPPDQARPQIVQRDKAFVPDLLVVSQGTTVEFPNWDPFSHNVFSRSRAAPFDLDRYGQGQSKSYTFDNAGVVQVFCNIHPQMRAVVVVVPNRFFARADVQGRFALRDVPPGQYVLVAWHARFGEQRKNIDVPREGLLDVSLALLGSGAREAAEPSESRARSAGVERGLGVKRERLSLPVVREAHPAPAPKR